MSLNSLTDSMKASIMSKIAGWIAILPSGSMFEAQRRHAAKILSSGDSDELSKDTSEGSEGLVSWLSGSVV